MTNFFFFLSIIDFLDESSYACADISERFLSEAKNNSFLLSQLFEYKKANFFKIGEDKIPLKYYDLIISTYVVPHIPKNKLNANVLDKPDEAIWFCGNQVIKFHYQSQAKEVKWIFLNGRQKILF